jgi:hypothetical protein
MSKQTKFRSRLVRMRFMDFCHHLFPQLDDSGASTFIIRIYDVSFAITFEPATQSAPQIFAFQPSGHIGFYPLSSISQQYIQLGGIQREMVDGDIVKTILTIIRDDEFEYDRFAGQTLIVRLVFKGTLLDSFFEIFNWVSSLIVLFHFSNSEFASDSDSLSISIPIPRPRHVKQLAKIRTSGDAVAFIMCRLGIPMWTMLQEMIVLRYFIDSQASCETLNQFLNLPLGHYVSIHCSFA